MALSPPRLSRALDSLERWRQAGLHLVPIRHHSPGCSAALAALLREVQPGTVLIEGPREYGALLPALADERTRPPVAVLSIQTNRTAFYPLADFSPEWVALRWGMTNGADVDFIDRSWDARDDTDPGAGVRTLQAEHHLARSTAIAELAARLGCRDRDELWEQLFELRTRAELTDWRGYCAEVLAWAGLARLEAERALLDGDGTHAREAVMSALIDRHRQTGRGPIVVVTGAFHTLALLEALDQTPEGHWVTDRDPGPLDEPRPAWLIRYDHARLDGLRGYGAGMPAPGFWQRAWRAEPATDGGRALTVDVLLQVAEALRSDGGLLSAAEVTAAAEQALRLAELRGRAWPGRTDLVDAMLSCFVGDDSGLSGPLGAAIGEVFGGTALGDLPPGPASPPLVAEARTQAEKLRFVIDDGASRQVSLDTQRKPAHVRRREFLATMRFVGSGFARQIGGADLVAGTGLGQFFEEWEYAWTPLVEAALIEASDRGATLAALRRAEIERRSAAEAASAATVAALVTELAVMGAADELPSALAALRSCYDTDASVASIVASLHQLASLLTATGRLALHGREAEIADLMESGLAATAFQLGPLADLTDDAAAEACHSVLALRGLLRRLAEPDLVGRVDAGGPRRELRRLRQRREAPAQLHGCLVAIAYTDRELDAAALQAEVAAHLHPGADPDRVAAFLLGLLQAAPDLIVHDPELLAVVNDRLGELSADAFLRVLPDLRQAFTWLRPTETARLAGQIAELTGASATELDAVLRFDPALAARALDTERLLVASLERDGLLAMIQEGRQ